VKKPSFVDPNKDPRYYINRYYKEPKYKEWFDRNYPNLTIEEAVGFEHSKQRKRKSRKQEKIFVIGMVALVIFAFFFIQNPDTLLGAVIHDMSEPKWDEVKNRNIVKQSIPITLLEENDSNCKVLAEKFDIIIDHEYFIRGESLATQLNFDREKNTLVVPCDLMHGEKSRLTIWYTLEESKLHSKKFSYSIAPWNDLKAYLNDNVGRLSKDTTIVISPSFTALAYSEGGFYDYFRGDCDESCLTVKIPEEIDASYTSSFRGFELLTKTIGYPFINDMDLSTNPDILSKYERVILLHNEYVTATEFEAIDNHPFVIYLYPNALYAEVSVDDDQKTMTLVRGHGYPTDEIINGFDWEFDNTHPYEYDIACLDWKFDEIDNGIMLNCYPEIILKDEEFKLIKKIIMAGTIFE